MSLEMSIDKTNNKTGAFIMTTITLYTKKFEERKRINRMQEYKLLDMGACIERKIHNKKPIRITLKDSTYNNKTWLYENILNFLWEEDIPYVVCTS